MISGIKYLIYERRDIHIKGFLYLVFIYLEAEKWSAHERGYSSIWHGISPWDSSNMYEWK